MQKQFVVTKLELTEGYQVVSSEMIDVDRHCQETKQSPYVQKQNMSCTALY